jgi:hypothetical protein
MTPNNESKQGKQDVPSPNFADNMGRLSSLSPEERIAIARKGGLAKSERKKVSCQLNPINTGNATKVIPITLCNNCYAKETCAYYVKDKACQIEINIRRNVHSQFKAIAGLNPEDMLREMFKTYQQLDEDVQKNPTFQALLAQMYLLIRIYDLKFGKGEYMQKSSISSNNTKDIKDLMKELRKD